MSNSITRNPSSTVVTSTPPPSEARIGVACAALEKAIIEIQNRVTTDIRPEDTIDEVVPNGDGSGVAVVANVDHDQANAKFVADLKRRLTELMSKLGYADVPVALAVFGN